ncbi:hypothetical protein K439DRAFT_1359143 [Ramaria rubella]|nr:hypothetical protein K439DRAFT_1359143 [Ramaria rubella]
MFTHRRPLLGDSHQIVIHMAESLSIAQIINYTGLKRRTVKQILSFYRHTGHIINSPGKTRGRKPLLDEGDHAFLQGSIAKSIDVYLDKLKESLEEHCGVSISLSTIWRALQKTGFNMKKVCTSDPSVL